MPNYEYECLNCGYRFEKFQKMSDSPLKVCPKCHKQVHRLIGIGGGIIFKGAGFYATDYRKDKAKEATKEKVRPEQGSSSKEASECRSDASKSKGARQQKTCPQDKKPSEEK